MNTILKQLQALGINPVTGHRRLIVELENFGRATVLDLQNQSVIVTYKDGKVSVAQPEHRKTDAPVDVSVSGAIPSSPTVFDKVVSLDERRGLKEADELPLLPIQLISRPNLDLSKTGSKTVTVKDALPSLTEGDKRLARAIAEAMNKGITEVTVERKGEE
ncbi:hypothetical protein ACYPKM_00660 [Pseudomonas aeruginosa]